MRLPDSLVLAVHVLVWWGGGTGNDTPITDRRKANLWEQVHEKRRNSTKMPRKNDVVQKASELVSIINVFSMLARSILLREARLNSSETNKK